jgi:PAS domain S-box-containing protein
MEKQTEENYEKYKFIAENSPDILLQTTKIGKITYMSRNVESVFGYKLDEIIGKHFRNFVPNSEMPKYLLKMKDMISGKTVTNFRTFAKHKNGDLIPIELSGKFVMGKNKSYFNAIMRNISDRVNFEEELKKSELQRKYILDTIPDLLFIINKNGIFTSYHGNREALYQSPRVFLNKKLNSILPEPLAEKTLKYVKKAIKTKKIQIFDYSLQIKNKINWFEARLIAINNEEVMSIIRDITSLKEQQNQIIKKDEYMQNIINSASEIIFTIDISNKIIIWNESAKKISGYNSYEIINKNIKDIEIINNYLEFKNYFSNIINNKKIDKIDLIINSKFDTKKIWRASPSIIYNSSNEISEILFICNDITYDKEIYSNIIFGRGYIFLDEKNDKAFNLFCNLSDKKTKGIIITREFKDKIYNTCTKTNIELIQFSSDKDKLSTVNNPDSLSQIIEKKLRKNSIIFIDRLDYFFNTYSFQEIIINLYKINEIVQKRKALLIIHINPDSISKEMIAALKEEFYEYAVEKLDDITIDKDQYEILEFIYSKNVNNIIVSHKEIGEEFAISKITVSKKINKLINLNLVKSSKRGRAKLLHLTNKGLTILKNRL